MNKRGQVSNVFIGLVTAGLAFLVLVIAIALIGQILQTQQDTQAVTTVERAVNESLTGNATLANAGTHTLLQNIANVSVEVTNTTVGVLTEGTDYTVRSDGVVTLYTDGGPYNMTYNYTTFTRTTEYNVSGQGLVGTSSVGDLLPTMGLLAGVVALLSLLALLTVMFGPAIMERF